MISWTYDYLRRQSHFVSILSAVKLRSMTLREGSPTPRIPRKVRICVKRPFTGEIFLRDRTSDLYTFREIVEDQSYRLAVSRALCCDFVMDIGANIGLTSLYLAAAFPTAKLFSIEPDASNYEMLEQNLRPLVKHRRAVHCNAAVWDKDAEICVEPAPVDGGFNRISVNESALSLKKVKAFTVSSLIEQSSFPRIDVMKLDVEGAERQVLQGDTGWLRRVNVMAIEFHGNSRRETDFDSIMSKNGFHIEDDVRASISVAYRDARSWIR